MAEEVSRIVPSNAYMDVVASVMMVYSIPPIIEDADALVVFPGLGEYWRVNDAIYWWHQCFSDFFLVAGINSNEKTWESLDIERLKQAPFFLKRMRGVETQIYAANTKEQAEWVYEYVVALGVEKLALFASPFHCLRAYLTLLKIFINHGVEDVILIPAPTLVSPSRLIPENQMSAWELVPGEVERIIKYQAKGDVATREELARYLKWLWKSLSRRMGLK